MGSTIDQYQPQPKDQYNKMELMHIIQSVPVDTVKGYTLTFMRPTAQIAAMLQNTDIQANGCLAMNLPFFSNPSETASSTACPNLYHLPKAFIIMNDVYC